MDEQELLKRLQAAFREEASERLLSIENQLIVLGKETSQTEFKHAIETVYREAHSLKGAARAVAMPPLEMFFQSAETVFSALKKETIKYDSKIAALLLRGIGTVERYMGTPGNPENMAELQNLCRNMDSFMHEEEQSVPAPKAAEKTKSAAAPEIAANAKHEESAAADNHAATADHARHPGSSVRVNKEYGLIARLPRNNPS